MWKIIQSFTYFIFLKYLAFCFGIACEEHGLSLCTCSITAIHSAQWPNGPNPSCNMDLQNCGWSQLCFFINSLTYACAMVMKAWYTRILIHWSKQQLETWRLGWNAEPLVRLAHRSRSYWHHKQEEILKW